MDHDRIYLTSEVAEVLDISVPTVRNYAKALERADHTFKMRKQSRLWTDTELNLVREVQHLYNTKDYPLEICFQYVVRKHHEGESVANEILERPQYITTNEALTPELAHIINDEFKGLRNELAKIGEKDYKDDFEELKSLIKNEHIAGQEKSEKEFSELNNEKLKLEKEFMALEEEKKQLEDQIKAIKEMNTFEFWKFKKD